MVLAILGINMLLALISRSLTLFEKHHTRSNEARSLAHRLFLAQVRWSDADCLADCLLWHGVLRCQLRADRLGQQQLQLVQCWGACHMMCCSGRGVRSPVATVATMLLMSF